MTDFGESVCLGMISECDVPCPFDHEEPSPPDVKNDLAGDGGTLRTRMADAAGTCLYAAMEKDVNAGLKPILDPRQVPGHDFCGDPTPVEIELTDASGSTTKRRLPVSTGAHHLIPAQESLKGHPLLTYMVKKGGSDGGAVWANVGYDVNGQQNGLFLPALYGVLDIWRHQNKKPKAGVDPTTLILTGNAYEISSKNLKWQYVRQVMRKCPGQLHGQRHMPYSKEVKGILTKIFENYKQLEKKVADKSSDCEECKKRFKKFEKEGIPTPHSLLNRLNKTSQRLASLLNGSGWAINIYTSRWCKEYMEQKKAGNKDAVL